MWKHKNNISW